MTLPNFIIIGVAKAGTTSLYRYLEQHPHIYMCPFKGTNYFGYEDAHDWKWHNEGDPPMLRNFRIKSFEEFEAAFSGATNEVAIGEASPQYFRCPTAADRIYDALPDVKLIASLRNPVERAFSGFLMRKRRGEAVKSAMEELTLESSHVKEGFYYNRMKRFVDKFPKEQMKIFLFDNFKKDTTGIMLDLYDFLGVNLDFQPDTTKRHNPAGIPRVRFLNYFYYNPALIRFAKAVFPESLQRLAKNVRQSNLMKPPELSKELRARLITYYHDDIQRLGDLLDMDLSIWLDGSGK